MPYLDKIKSATLIRCGLALPMALLASGLYAYSMAQETGGASGNYVDTFFKGMAVGSTSGLLNIVARILDHHGDSEKFKNRIAGMIYMLLASSQIVVGVGAGYGQFSMPIGISPFMNTVGMFLGAILNWQPAARFQDSCQANRERYLGFVFIALSMASSIINLVTENKAAFFAAAGFFDVTMSLDSLNRIRDIFLDPQSHCLNKTMIILFTVVMTMTFMVNLTVSGLNFFADKNVPLPIAFPNGMLALCLSFYAIAQSHISILTNLCEDARSKFKNNFFLWKSRTDVHENPKAPLLTQNIGESFSNA